MWIFLLILAIALLIGGIICVFNASDSYEYEDLLIFGAVFGIFIGVFLLIISSIGLCGGFEKPTTTQAQTEIVSDSTQVKTPCDTLKYMKLIISWKDDDGVWAGRNVKIVGYTNKQVGDTLTIKLP